MVDTDTDTDINVSILLAANVYAYLSPLSVLVLDGVISNGENSFFENVPHGSFSSNIRVIMVWLALLWSS